MKRNFSFLLFSAILSAAPSISFCAPVLSGLDVLEQVEFSPLKGKIIGLITNQTGRNSNGESGVEILGRTPTLTLAAVFSPEHGYTGSIEAGDKAASSELKLANGRRVPIYSLYKGGLKGMRPTEDELKGLDALVFDIQDAGARFYTYAATMAMAMEESQKRGMEFFVLDRPNPINGVTVEGPLPDDTLRDKTSVTYHKVPVRHGMTVGEIATMYAAEIGYKKLTVVKMRGWRRDMWYDQTGLPWIAPSPNLPDLDSATLYPGVAVFEASNLSVGRGTPWPFRWIGAPWLNAPAIVAEMNAAHLDGVRFSVADATPSKDPFTGKLCRGVLWETTDRERVRPVTVFGKLYEAVRRANSSPTDPADSKSVPTWDKEALKRMLGPADFQPLADSEHLDPDAIQSILDSGIKRFEASRQPFLLY